MSDVLSRLASALGDRYQIEREIGAGGMATVYLARDLKHHRPVALKVLRPELAKALGGERFLREIEIAAQLEHPHVLTLIDSGDADGMLYYVMPFVEGESLRHRLSREGQLPVADVVRLLRDVADGLAEAHRRGLIHRDIKPDNVMISGRHAVVTDFGVAKALTSATGPQNLTTAGIALGTPAYMSPEQVTADPNIDHRTDLYALGVMAYELLAGHPPFLGGTSQEVLAGHLTTSPRPVNELRPDTPPALVAVVMQCLEKKAEDRIQSTDEVLQRLEAIATPSGGVPSLRMEAKPAASGRALRIARAGVLAAVGVAAVVLVVSRQRQAGAMRALVAELRPAADSGRLDEVYTGLGQAGVTLESSGLRELAALVGGVLQVETEPSRAVVSLQRVSDALAADSSTTLTIGQSPVTRLLVAGNYVVSLEAPETEELRFTITVRRQDTLRVQRSLVPRAWDAAEMVVINAGTVHGPVVRDLSSSEVPAFLIDRHEVTNEDFMGFVAAGGYGHEAWWPDTMVLAGDTLPRAEALAALTDRTGLPGPRGWSGGSFPADRARYPVTGVSWYEAAAFAQWAGKQLPDLGQWWRAALGDADHPFPWGDDLLTIDSRSNFSMLSATPVDQYPLGVGPFGVYDMAGNVREWLRAPADSGRAPAVGGSWQDPTYMFSTPNMERFPLGFASDAIGFRLVKPVP